MDETARLMAREIPRLRRYATTLTGNVDEADDLVQDALERAMRKRNLWRGSGSIRSWLYRIVFSVFANQARQRRRRRAELALEAAPTLAAPARQEDAAACRDIAGAMARLPLEQRAAIALTAVEGFAYDEAAAILGVPIGTVRSRVARGRDALRAFWEAPTAAEEAEPAPARRVAPHLRRVK